MQLSFVFPCLNEKATLADCLVEVKTALAAAGRDLEYEIVVADNGSTDRSPEIARAHGARVVRVAERGYGAALRGGIEAARGDYVVFADADRTYPLEDTLRLYRTCVAEDADMAIASRTAGTIERGAMPFLHRRLGTPVLTGLINVLFRGRLSDCNSGFRCIRKSSWRAWNTSADGMEFASELLVKALKAGAKIVEVPAGLRRGPADRAAHLRTWRDGMRHLLYILSERPQAFELVGLALVLGATVLQGVALAAGPVELLGLSVFDVHTQLLLLLAAVGGTQVYTFGCVLFIGGEERSTTFTRRLLALDEGVLFFLLLAIGAVTACVVAGIVASWALRGFSDLHLARPLVGLVHLVTVLGLTAIGLLGVHVFQKSGR